MENFISYMPKNTVEFFTYTDNEQRFFKNKKNQPSDWIYNTKNVTYSYNKHGFRDKNFIDISWKESVVIIGCSMAMGEGIAHRDTISKQLEDIINCPVVNLGIYGAGIDLTCWNSTILHEKYHTPKALVHLWTGLDRYSDVQENPYAFLSTGPWKPGYNHKLNWLYRSKKYVETDRALWKNKTIYYEASFFEKTANELVIDSLKTYDIARDLMHPGIESAKFAAEKIAENLYKQGL